MTGALHHQKEPYDFPFVPEVSRCLFVFLSESGLICHGARLCTSNYLLFPMLLFSVDLQGVAMH